MAYHFTEPPPTLAIERETLTGAVRQGRLTLADPPMVAKLTNGRQLGKNQWMAHCPCHADRKPSLSIRWGRNGQTLVKCQAGCKQQEVLAWFRRGGFRLDQEPPPKAKRPKRPASLSTSVALKALTLNERRMYEMIKAGENPTYDQFCEAGVRRQSIPGGNRTMEALGLIAVKRSPYNVRTERYGRNVYRLGDGWQAFEPGKASPQAKKAALAKAREIARKARNPEGEG